MLLPSLSLQFRVHTRVLLTLAIALALTIGLWAEPKHQQLIHEAEAAMKADNFPVMLAKAEAAAAERPDYPRYLLLTAIAQAVNERPAEAFLTLNRIADLGVAVNIARQPAFAKLKERAEFSALEKRFAANLTPAGSVDSAFTLPEMTGIIEGFARRAATGDFFFGDVHQRCIWRREANGTVTKFAAADGLFGAFGLAIDEKRGALFAATSALPEMSGFTSADENKGGVAEFDLATGKLRRLVLLAADGRKHAIGDLAIAPDGAVYATDSFAPVIWRLALGANSLEKFIDDGDTFGSPQGIAFAPDGKFFYLTDYNNGLFRIETATRSARRLVPPAGASFIGLDGLVLTPSGLIATQNGVNPVRILRLTLDTDGENVTRVTPLVSGRADLSDVALGCYSDGWYYFTGQSGWALFEPPTATPPARTVTISALKP